MTETNSQILEEPLFVHTIQPTDSAPTFYKNIGSTSFKTALCAESGGSNHFCPDACV